MTLRSGLFVAIAGFVLVALCATPLFVFPDLDPTRDDAVLGVVLLGLGALLGFTIMAVGLIIATAAAMTAKRARARDWQFSAGTPVYPNMIYLPLVVPSNTMSVKSPDD